MNIVYLGPEFARQAIVDALPDGATVSAPAIEPDAVSASLVEADGLQ